MLSYLRWVDVLFSDPLIHNLDKFPNVSFMQRIIAAHDFFHRYSLEYGLEGDVFQPLIIGERPPCPILRGFLRIKCRRIGRLFKIKQPEAIPQKLTAGSSGDITRIPFAELISNARIHEIRRRLSNGDMAGINGIIKHVAKILLCVLDIQV